MNETIKALHRTGLAIPHILLPKADLPLKPWAVIACDQYTAQPDYWNQVENLTKGHASTYHFTLPEIYLNENNVHTRIKTIISTMQEYVTDGVLRDQGPTMVLTERRFDNGQTRIGLVAALDLEQYEYTKGATSLIRPTEGTVVDRLPPRLSIRKQATIESPHVMVLIDDPEHTVIEPLYEHKNKEDILYDTELMLGGGHIRGYRVDDIKKIEHLTRSVQKLMEPKRQQLRYGIGDNQTIGFAVGDGNHSLATAKAHWESIKNSRPNDFDQNHPARFALVEIVNIYDPGLMFLPIHRVLFHTNPSSFMVTFEQATKKLAQTAKITPQKPEFGFYDQIIRFRICNRDRYICLKNPIARLAYGSVDAILEEVVKAQPQCIVDYIHGEDQVDALCTDEKNVGFYMEAIDKTSLFQTITREGVLPRKSFSMGHAHEKRYYMECRSIC